MSAALPVCVPRRVLRHWFEPWRVAHASWLQAAVAPPCWSTHVAGSPTAARTLRRVWLDHLGIAEHLPPDDDALQWVALPEDGLDAASRLLGLMVASHWPGFLAGWAVDPGSRVAGAGGPEVCRRVTAMGRVRRLPRPPALEGSTAAPGIDLVGAAYLRALLDDVAAGVWPRVRLGLHREAAARLDAAAAPPSTRWLAPQERRHATLAWNRICQWQVGSATDLE